MLLKKRRFRDRIAIFSKNQKIKKTRDVNCCDRECCDHKTSSSKIDNQVFDLI